jgi:hypothetical protein
MQNGIAALLDVSCSINRYYYAVSIRRWMHLTRVVAEVTAVPALHQTAIHPYFHQTELQRLHGAHKS